MYYYVHYIVRSPIIGVKVHPAVADGDWCSVLRARLVNEFRKTFFSLSSNPYILPRGGV